MKTRENLKMFDKTKQCCSVMLKSAARFHNFIFTLTLRQGTILIAVHQIALSSFVLLVLLVGVSHVGEMQNLLHSDMEDDAERRGFYDVAYGDQLLFHEGDGVSTNNQKRFATAQSLASLTVALLYTVTVLMAVYLLCCVGLLHGAVSGKREYVYAWIVCASVAAVIAIGGAVIGNNYQIVVDIFGSHHMYQIYATIGILAFVYGILCVSTYALELTVPQLHMHTLCVHEGDKERLLLLDHTAHSNILTTAQLGKLAQKNSYQFV